MRHAALVVALLAAVAVFAGPLAGGVAGGGPGPAVDDRPAVDGRPAVDDRPAVDGRQAVDGRPTLADQSAATPTGGSATSSATLATVDDPAVRFHVTLQPDGDARWVVTMRFELADDADREAFRDYGESFRDGGVEAPAGADVETFRAAASGASTVAGRPMNVTNVSRGYAIPEPSTGLLQLSFTWTNFLGQQGNRLILRDALLAPEPGGANGTWLNRLGPRQTLVIDTPEGFSIESQPGVPYRNDSLIVEGPYEFSADDPFVVTYERVSNPNGPTTTTSTPPFANLPIPALVGVLVAIVVVLGVAAFRRSDRGGDAAASTAPQEPATGDAPASTAAEAAGDEPAEDQGEEPAPELLSDEERVEHLLENHEGRMRQADIVSETGWSDAKVSQLLSEMAEAGSVEKLRIGRENLISLADDDGDAGGSGNRGGSANGGGSTNGGGGANSEDGS